MYRPRMFLRWAVVLVSAVLYPRTMRQPYSYFKGSVVSLTEYTVNSLHQILPDRRCDLPAQPDLRFAQCVCVVYFEGHGTRPL